MFDSSRRSFAGVSKSCCESGGNAEVGFGNAPDDVGNATPGVAMVRLCVSGVCRSPPPILQESAATPGGGLQTCIIPKGEGLQT